MATRRMQGTPGWHPPHHEEHDEVKGDAWNDCAVPPTCKPVTEEPTEEPPPYDPPPSHYDGEGGLMPWHVVDAFGLDFYLGNVSKYILRAGKKGGESRLKDLSKALNYLKKAIELEEGRDE